MCVVKNQTGACTQDSDCSIGSFTLRKCDVGSGCCVNKQAAIASCTDSIQNCHDGACEKGVDCEGPCARTCGSGGDVCSGKYFSDWSCFYPTYGGVMWLILGALLFIAVAFMLIYAYEKGWIG
jgi:hypothetical protein